MSSIGNMLPQQLRQLDACAWAVTPTGRQAQRTVPRQEPTHERCRSKVMCSRVSKIARSTRQQQQWPMVGRGQVAAMATARTADGMPEMNDEMMERIEASTKLIGELIMEVSRDIFVAEAAGNLTGAALAATETAAIRKAVESRIDILDEAFLVTLMGFVQASEAEGVSGMSDRLRAISEEVLRSVRSHLPPEVQLLDILMGTSGSENRLAMVRVAADGGDGAEVPAVELERLVTTAATLIDDMEDKEEIMDRKLLAKVCLVREEIENVDRQRQISRTGTVVPLSPANGGRQGVPRRAVAFLKELMAVNQTELRLALLKKAFISDWDGAAPMAQSEKAGANKPDAVRPGQFLTTLNVTQVEMLKPEAGVSEAILKRLEDVRLETLQTLVLMAEG